MKKDHKKEDIWKKLNAALRDPVEILAADYGRSGIISKLLIYKADIGFINILQKLGITLIVTREYEHLALSLNAAKGHIDQSFMHIPHPSGVAIDRDKNRVYIVSTRNPNQLWEFSVALLPHSGGKFLMPSRVRFLPGSYYLHDLAMIGAKLYANSVGRNVVVEIDKSSLSDKIVWWPKCVEKKDGTPDTSHNFIQLNSISGGSSIKDSFFTASGDRISRRRPGQMNYPVDKLGVVFSGRTREVCARGLTRPHSARLYKGRVWVDNSGYGEFGYIEKERFVPIIKLPGWTRGLCIINDIAFVGVSRILPKFKNYAPGINQEKQKCGVFLIDLNRGDVIGSIVWPYGNQIFAIDRIGDNVCDGFLFKNVRYTSKKEYLSFYYSQQT